MTRTSLALGFGWFCGAMTQQITDTFVWSLSLGLLAGLSFGVAQAIWDNAERESNDGL